MRHTARRSLLTVVATGSALASTAGYAHAAATATGTAADSPGVASGNSVQAPVEVPINVCGNTVDVVGLLNPAYGNSCGNHGNSAGSGGSGRSGGSTATGGTHGSPGVGSGNTVHAPVDVPVNACGDSVNVVGVGNPAFGNHCANHSGGEVTPPPTHCGCHPTPPPGQTPPPSHQPPPPPTSSVSTSPTPGHSRNAPPPSVSATSGTPGTQLASTGGGADTGLLAGAGLALMGGGALLYRRARTVGRH